jgi:ATP/maltotriose-dependent transcriptional regulator MalT
MTAGVTVKRFQGHGLCVLAGLLACGAGAAAAPDVQTPATTLADALMDAKSPADRAALLATHRAGATRALFDELLARGVRQAPVEPRKALPAFEAALAVAETLGDDALRATALTSVGLAHVFGGELETAAAYQRQAEQLAEKAGDKKTWAYVWTRGAELLFQQGDHRGCQA